MRRTSAGSTSVTIGFEMATCDQIATRKRLLDAKTVATDRLSQNAQFEIGIGPLLAMSDWTRLLKENRMKKLGESHRLADGDQQAFRTLYRKYHVDAFPKAQNAARINE